MIKVVKSDIWNPVYSYKSIQARTRLRAKFYIYFSILFPISIFYFSAERQSTIAVLVWLSCSKWFFQFYFSVRYLLRSWICISYEANLRNTNFYFLCSSDSLWFQFMFLCKSSVSVNNLFLCVCIVFTT